MFGSVVRVIAMCVLKSGRCVENTAPTCGLRAGSQDDWITCPRALAALVYFVARAAAEQPRFAALRASYGFNGIVLRRADLPALAAALDAGAARRPPDLTFAAWHEAALAAERRPLVAFRHNLWRHVGAQSAVGNGERFAPACYELLYDWLQPSELFHVEVAWRESV